MPRASNAPADGHPTATDVPRKNGGSTSGRNDGGGIAGPGRLTSIQEEIVALCADAVQQLGLSRSVGQIFGVLYASPRPLAFADVVALLDVSAGSVSQGLHLLRELGAIRPVAVEGDRREYFEAETELRRLLARLLHTRLRPPIESGARRVQALHRRLGRATGPEADFLRQRVGSLETWHRKALRFLPFIETAIGVPKD